MISDSEATLFRSAAIGQPDFERVAKNGFGDPLNAYAHSMAWFKDHLYVGTTRANLCMIKFNDPAAMRVWPTKCPDDIDDLDRRAQVWRFSPRTRTWQEVYRSPLITGHGGRKVARDIGYRGMAVFQGRSDSSPVLYLCGWSPSRSERPPIILRCSDGENFEAISPPGNDPQLNTYRTLFAFGSRLYTSPTGRTSGWRKGVFQGSRQNVSESPVVLATTDPKNARWRAACEFGFGDSTNVTAFEFAAFNGHLYAGTLNPTRGFQLWKTRATGSPPYKWKRVITDGAYRGNLNECATSMCVFDDALYIGTGIQNGGYDKTYKVGPAAAELIRVYEDDTWDLIVGRPRKTPDGFKYPLSGFGPGFDNFYNAYFWRMAVHQGCLYLGTYKWTIFLPYLPRDKWPAPVKAYVESIGVDTLVEEDAGFDLWRTSDGVHWGAITMNGFNNRYNYGARTMTASPYGLFVASANPFGPLVANRNRRGWQYRPNPLGGLEVWLSASSRAAADTSESGGPARLPATLGGYTLSPPWQEDVVRTIASRYDVDMYGPVASDYFGSSDFFNFGYWDEHTKTQKQASENLVEQLLSYIPRKKGTILDVACGKGATTRYLLKSYMPKQVVGINISKKQLESCKKNAPGVRFLMMDAAELKFRDNSFDNILCVEAACHFDTREKFLREAFRVLKPGGRLVISDLLLSWFMLSRSNVLTYRNYVPNPAAYKKLLAKVGFQSVSVVDAIEKTWMSYFRHSSRYVGERLRRGDYSESLTQMMLFNAAMQRHLLHYVIACGVKRVG